MTTRYLAKSLFSFAGIVLAAVVSLPLVASLVIEVSEAVVTSVVPCEVASLVALWLSLPVSPEVSPLPSSVMVG